MKISIFGAGYVGAVSGACLSELGHSVKMVDVNRVKVDLIANGISPIVEAGLGELIAKHTDSGALGVCETAAEAVEETDVSVVCVGTPSLPNGDLNLAFVKAVCEEIGAAMATKDGRHTVIMRSTMLPGSMETLVIPTLEAASGLTAREDFGIAIYPEFLRESTAVEDFFAPAIMLLGVDDDQTLQVMRKMNNGIESREISTSISTAEAIKYANNAWHAVKLTFANEIGNICKAAGIDGQTVMEILCEDDRLNISKAYMRHGYAFGGSCLPKDLRALTAKARQLGVETPLFDGTLKANAAQVDRAAKMVEGAFAQGRGNGVRKVAMLGLAFKSGTDDLRESPLVTLADRLLGDGYTLKIFDENVRDAALSGANLETVTGRLKHLSGLFEDELEKAAAEADVIVVGNGDARFREAVANARSDQAVIDLVRVSRDRRSDGTYEGICW